MQRFAILIPRLLACLALAWQPSSALGQEEDTQLWIYGVATTDLGDATRLTVDATARWREEARGDEQQTLRFTILHEIGKGVRIGGGGGVFETEGGGTELRPHQQVTVRAGQFSARTRIEQRFFDNTERMEVRLRQLVRYQLPLGEKVSFSLDGEYLGLAQTRESDSNRPRDQWRARLILSTEVSDALTLGAGYLAILTPRDDAVDQINHVPQAYLTMRF